MGMTNQHRSWGGKSHLVGRNRDCYRLSGKGCTKGDEWLNECVDLESRSRVEEACPRIVQSILSLGLGYSALEKFCMRMNLSIMSSKTFNSYKAKVLNGHLVGSNQLYLDVRKNVREAYGSKNDKDIVDIGVPYEMEAG
ncbi:uncharacterized protein TNCV_1868381 [Trichonephila clavipes]|nr:uncharacterized protein TNCV_1868381 [Trichonephila clavipes]